jgi:hypothetical protein
MNPEQLYIATRCALKLEIESTKKLKLGRTEVNLQTEKEDEWIEEAETAYNVICNNRDDFIKFLQKGLKKRKLSTNAS